MCCQTARSIGQYESLEGKLWLLLISHTEPSAERLPSCLLFLLFLSFSPPLPLCEEANLAQRRWTDVKLRLVKENRSIQKLRRPVSEKSRPLSGLKRADGINWWRLCNLPESCLERTRRICAATSLIILPTVWGIYTVLHKLRQMRCRCSLQTRTCLLKVLCNWLSIENRVNQCYCSAVIYKSWQITLPFKFSSSSRFCDKL